MWIKKLLLYDIAFLIEKETYFLNCYLYLKFKWYSDDAR